MGGLAADEGASRAIQGAGTLEAGGVSHAEAPPVRSIDCSSVRDDLWQPAREDELRTLWAEGASASAIGRALGCSKNAVLGKARRLGLPGRRAQGGKRWTAAEDARLTRMAERGFPRAAMALDIGRSPAVIAKRLAKLFLTRPRPGRPTDHRPRLVLAPAPPLSEPMEPPLPIRRPAAIVRLGQHCQFIEREPSAHDACKCGDQVPRLGQPYCARHAKRTSGGKSAL